MIYVYVNKIKWTIYYIIIWWILQLITVNDQTSPLSVSLASNKQQVIFEKKFQLDVIL